MLHYSPSPFGINVHLCHLSERGQSVLHSVLSSIHFFLLVTLCLWWNAVVLRARFSRVSEKVGHADLVSPSWFRWLKQEVPRSPLWLNMSGKCLYGLASEKKKKKKKITISRLNSFTYIPFPRCITLPVLNIHKCFLWTVRIDWINIGNAHVIDINTEDGGWCQRAWELVRAFHLTGLYLSIFFVIWQSAKVLRENKSRREITSGVAFKLGEIPLIISFI